MDTTKENTHRDFLEKLEQLPHKEKTYWLNLIRHAQDLYHSGRGSEIENYIKLKYKEKTGRYYGQAQGSA